jgi:membrane-associated phospholipid phosphatase
MPIVVASLAGWLFILSHSAPSSPAAGATSALHDSITAIRSPSSRATERAAAPDRLAYRSHVDVPVTVLATAAWIAAEIDKTHLVSVNCKWCDRAPDGSSTLNGLDSWGRRAFLWRHTGRAITASHITGFVLAPAAAYGLDWMAASRDGRKWDAPVDALLITQAMAIASDVTQAMKFTIGRERPFVHALAPPARATTPDSADNNTSFPSGHATLAFALATSSSEIAVLRGYGSARWFLRAGLPLATLTAYLRVAADRHYVTDVLAGAGVGAAAGFGVPYLAHRNKTDRRVPAVRIVPAMRGEMVAAQWVW